MQRHHQEIMERIAYLTSDFPTMDLDDKLIQLRMIFDMMALQYDKKFLLQEIVAMANYAFTDSNAVFHMNVYYKGGNLDDDSDDK